MASVTRDQLYRPVQETARQLALAWLAEADAALARLPNNEDTEALHDFRVSLRRFRSSVRAYQPHLKGSAPKKARRRMGALASGTNAGRDAEVQIAWLESQRDGLTRDELAGWHWLVTHADERRADAYGRARRQIARGFRTARRAVERRFSAYEVQLSPSASQPQTPTFVQVTGELIREHAGELRDLLSLIESAQDEQEAHAARIAAKRLRYLLEPLSKSVAGVKPQIKDLKRLQDILGELNDAHVMSAEIAAAIEIVAAEQARQLHRLALEKRTTDEIAEAESPLPGLLALTRLSGERRDRLFQALSDHWLGDSASIFFSRVSRLAADMIGQAEPHTEIERKYLLTGLPDHARQGHSILIDQGWIAGGQIQERLRRVRSPDGVRFYRTVKSGSGLVRLQLEERISRRAFQQLWRLTEGRRLRKRRYVVAEDELTWEIDEFLDRDLVLAEVELPSADFQVTLPEWLEPLVGREVTGRSEYENVNLARKTPINRPVKKRRRS